MRRWLAHYEGQESLAGMETSRCQVLSKNVAQTKLKIYGGQNSTDREIISSNPLKWMYRKIRSSYECKQ